MKVAVGFRRVAAGKRTSGRCPTQIALSERKNEIHIRCYPRKTKISSYARAGAIRGTIGIGIRGVRETKKLLDNKNNYIVIEHI